MKTLIEKHYIANYNAYCKAVYYRAGKCPFATEDIVQTAFERALRYCDSYNPMDEFTGWFVTILNNSVHDFMADERRLGMKVDVTTIEETGAPMGEWEFNMVSEIRRHIANKPSHHADILHLHFIKGYALRDIEKIVDETYRNINSILSRFRTEIRERYGKDMLC